MQEIFHKSLTNYFNIFNIESDNKLNYIDFICTLYISNILNFKFYMKIYMLNDSQDLLLTILTAF